MRFLVLSILLLINIDFVCATELILPKPTGPYSVGTQAIEIKDPSRTNLRDKNPRRWMIQAFYPTEAHKQTYPYMPSTLDDGSVENTKILAHGKPNSPILKGHKFPVIFYKPGLGGERQKSTILLEELASHGYLVLSFDQPYQSNFVRFPDDEKIVLTLKDAWNIPRDREYRYAYYDLTMGEAIDDIKYVIDHLEGLNAQYFGHTMDKDFLILMGHSFGGNVAHTLGFQDGRINAIIDIDSKITERAIYGHVGVPQNPQAKPVLFIRGMMQYQDDVGEQLNQITNATIWQPNVEHSAFSDKAFFVHKIPNFGQQGFFSDLMTWFFKRGPHWSAVDTNLGAYDVEEWFKEYRQYMIEWLRDHAPKPHS